MYTGRVFFIISTAAGLSDIKAVTDRLLQNPKDFAGLLKTFYGEKSAQEFDRLLTQHLLIGGDLVNAAKDNDKNKADEVRKKMV